VATVASMWMGWLASLQSANCVAGVDEDSITYSGRVLWPILSISKLSAPPAR
jgi:hypothetical protein